MRAGTAGGAAVATAVDAPPPPPPADGRIELGESTGTPIVADGRPRMGEPPPVRLVAVEDVRLPTGPGLEAALDGFYVGLLAFRREADAAPDPRRAGEQYVYRAENARLRLTVVHGQRPAERDGVRPQGIEVSSLAAAERRLFAAEVEYVRERGLLPGQLALLSRDPAGNWVELVELGRV